MQKNLKSGLIITASLLFVLLCSQCSKVPGDGGLASIHGKVYSYNVNTYGIKTDSGYTSDVKVYLSYGDNAWVDQDVNTSYTGDYAFEWLRPGEYRLFVEQWCDTCPMHKGYDVEYVTISGRKETQTIRDLISSY